MSHEAPDDHEPEAPLRSRGVYLLPNLLTTGTLFSGFYAIVAAIDGNFTRAGIAVFVAMIFDGLDGRVARWTRTQSESPSRHVARIAPVSSTWPCTAWPLFRASLAAARSKLTGAPAVKSIRFVRRIVSGAQPTVNDAASNAVTVKHVPFTAMEHPSYAPLSTTLAEITNTQPSPTLPSHSATDVLRVNDTTRPISSTMPVNIASARGLL